MCSCVNAKKIYIFSMTDFNACNAFTSRLNLKIYILFLTFGRSSSRFGLITPPTHIRVQLTTSGYSLYDATTTKIVSSGFIVRFDT